jgi:chromosome segregation ATPase
MRLIYYDQNSELDRIYKNADSENFVSDSLEMRRLIFQLLVGKSYNAYYESVAKEKAKKKEYDKVKGAFDHNNEVADEILRDKENLNLKFLNSELVEKQEQIQKLYISREAIQNNRPKNTANLDDVETLKEELESVEENLYISKRELGAKEKELFDLKYLKQNLVLEVTQLKKIITTHEKLGFFTPDTCPNCLRQVKRKEGYCICGNEIEEDQYIKLFYSEEEYLDILKEKQNSIETVSKSINVLSGRVNRIHTQVGNLSSKARGIEKEIRNLLSEVSDDYNTSSIDRIDDKILELKSEISDLNEQIRIEEKRQSLQRKLDRTRDELKRLENQTQALYSEAEQDMQDRINDFNIVYNEFMTSALKDCKNAKIDPETYLPIINEGTYRERSARVPIRLMYFFTLLKLSVQSESLNFPRFLLIDTPEAAGIDDINLIPCIEQINSIFEEGDDFQIIMTTGMGKYPEEFGSFVVETLEDEPGKRLLKKVPQSDEEE